MFWQGLVYLTPFCTITSIRNKDFFYLKRVREVNFSIFSYKKRMGEIDSMQPLTALPPCLVDNEIVERVVLQ